MLAARGQQVVNASGIFTTFELKKKLKIDSEEIKLLILLLFVNKLCFNRLVSRSSLCRIFRIELARMMGFL